MAASRGLVLVLLEENYESLPGTWSFAVDLVIELGVKEREALVGVSVPLERRLAISKNRFGPSEPGAHLFTIAAGSGVRVLPQPKAYLSRLAHRVVLPEWHNDVDSSQSWQPTIIPSDWPAFHECTTAIYGAQTRMVYHLANALGTRSTNGHPYDGVDLVVTFGIVEHPGAFRAPRITVDCRNPFLSGDFLLADAVKKLEEIRLAQRPIRRVLIGDLRSIRTFSDAEGIRRAIGVLVVLLQRIRVPAILYETVGEHLFTTANALIPRLVGVPPIVDLADLVIGIEPVLNPSHGAVTQITHVRFGKLLMATTTMSMYGQIGMGHTP
jgi:hypothetical protein